MTPQIILCKGKLKKREVACICCSEGNLRELFKGKRYFQTSPSLSRMLARPIIDFDRHPDKHVGCT